MKHGGTICLILFVIIFVLILVWSRGEFRMKPESFAGGSLPTPTSGNLYKISKAQISASENEVEEKVVTVDNQGRIVVSEFDDVLHARPDHKCLDNAVYNEKTHLCECPAGFSYSTRLGCLSDCETYQEYQTDQSVGGDGAGGWCMDRCLDPNTYYNATTGSCVSCPVGYQTNDTNVCSPLTPCNDHQVFNDANVCTDCPEGQIAGENNQCVNVCLDYQRYNPLAGTCVLACPPYEYKDFSSSAEGVCRACPHGYVNDGSNTCVLAPECPEGQRMDDHAQCMNQCLNWETYDPISETCLPKCNVKNSAGFYTQYMDLHGTDTCKDCGATMVSNGKNECVQGPTVPAPTCAPGYHMDYDGKCEMNCPAPWRKYDFNTDSCVMRCPDRNQHWNESNKGCEPCPAGFKTDAMNQCTVGIPKAPIFNTPAPTCAPGFIPDANGKCVSACPAFAINNADDPLLCDHKCQLLNQYWDKTHPDKCSTCTNGYYVDTQDVCNFCDLNAEYLPTVFKFGTLGYSQVADALPGDTARGYSCKPKCAPGYLVNMDSTTDGYNSCSVCDSAPNPTRFIAKYSLDNQAGSATQGQCVPVCSAPNVLNRDNMNSDHPCNLCLADYTTDMVENNPHLVQNNIDPNLRRCMPSTCDIGYIIGPDFKCSSCDTAAGYTNDFNQVDAASKIPSLVYRNPGNKVCFPKTCPNGTALGMDLSCSVCAVGNYGNALAGCGPPIDEMVSYTTDNVVPGDLMTYKNSKYVLDKFIMDITFDINVSNYAFATISLGDIMKHLPDAKNTFDVQNTKVTFKNVTITDKGLGLTIKYYSNKSCTGNPVATSAYDVNYSSNLMSNLSSPVIGHGDFAIAYILKGGGGSGHHTEASSGDCNVEKCALTWVGDDATICKNGDIPLIGKKGDGDALHRRCCNHC